MDANTEHTMDANTKTAIEEQEKTFLKGLRDIVQSTKDTKLLDINTINSPLPNIFFIYAQNKNYPDFNSMQNELYLSRTEFHNADLSTYPLMSIAQELYRRFRVADCDNLEMMTLIYPNIHHYRLGTLFGYADVGMQASMKNEPEKYYVGKNHKPSHFCVQIVPHPNHLKWLKEEKGIQGYFLIDKDREAERFIRSIGPVDRGHYYKDMEQAMLGLGYHYHNAKGILFDGARANDNLIWFNRDDDRRYMKWKIGLDSRRIQINL